MTKREIASLTIKLMGVFILLKSIAYVPMAYSVLFNITRTGSTGILKAILFFMLLTLTAALPLGFSILVIMLSDKGAAWLIKEDASIENTGNAMNKEDVMVIAISCLGLYFTVAAIPMLIQGLWAWGNRQAGMPYWGPSAVFTLVRNLIAPAVQIGLGVGLFIGSKGIVKLWKKIRS